jgi:hypothetical protein
VLDVWVALVMLIAQRLLARSSMSAAVDTRLHLRLSPSADSSVLRLGVSVRLFR